MEIPTTIKLVYEKFKLFEDYFNNQENLSLEIINKEKMTSALLESGLLYDNCEIFINLIYDEQEENRVEITKKKFLEKYNHLLKFIEEEKENLEEDKISCINVIQEKASEETNEKEILIEDFLQEKEEEENEFKNLYVNIKEADSADQSEILHAEKSNELNNDDEISIDANNLFNNLNFENFHLNEAEKKTNKDSSVVKPINTFNFNIKNLHENEFKSEKKIFFTNNIFNDSYYEPNRIINPSVDKNNLKISSHQKHNFKLDNKLKVSQSTSGNFINYMQNVNINLNNYGNLNVLDSLSGSRINSHINKIHLNINMQNKFTPYLNSPLKNKLIKNNSNSQSQNLKQKIKEVYQELNKNQENSYRNIFNKNEFENSHDKEEMPDKRLIEEKHLNNFENKFEKFENIQDINKLKRNLQELNDENENDYFSDIFKSLKSAQKNQKNISALKSISERLNNKSTKLNHGIHNLEFCNPNKLNTKLHKPSLKISKNKFQDLKKLLGNPNTTESNEIINPYNVFKRKLETEKFKGFDEIEEKINKLKTKNLANKRKSLINMNSCCSMTDNFQNRDTERKKIQNLINNLLEKENIINIENEIEGRKTIEIEKLTHIENHNEEEVMKYNGVNFIARESENDQNK